MKNLIILITLFCSLAFSQDTTSVKPLDIKVKQSEWVSEGMMLISVYTIDNHDYILSITAKGVSMVHSESCSCKH